MAVSDSNTATQGALSPDAQVLITIGVRGTSGRLLRQGTIGRAVRDFSLLTVLSHAVHPDFMNLLADRRPGQFAEEKEVADLVSKLLSQEHRVFVNNLDEPMDARKASEVRVKDLLRRVPYPKVTMYSLHAKLEPILEAKAFVETPVIAPQSVEATAAVTEAPASAAEPSVAPSPPVEIAPPVPETPVIVTPTPVIAEVAPVVAPPVVEQVEVEEIETAESTFMEPAPVAVVTPPPPAITPVVVHKHVRGQAKVDALKERYHDVVMNLDLKGLFVGNFGLGQTVDTALRLGRLSEHALQEYLLSANFLRKAKDYERAAGIYSILIKYDPTNPDYHFLLGKTYFEMGEREQALQCYRAAVKLGHEGAPLEIARIEARSEH